MSDQPKTGFLQTLCQSLLCAVCVAPIAVLGAIVLTAHNERSSVCVMHAVDDGYATVETVPCHPAKHSTSEDDLFMFRCPLDKDVSKWGPSWPGYHDFTSFGPLHFEGIALNAHVQMYQCIEHVKTNNGTRTYSYEKSFHTGPAPRLTGPNWQYYCGQSNPSWPAGVPQSAYAHAPVVKAGDYQLPQSMINSIPISTPVNPISNHGHGHGHGHGVEWQSVGSGVYLANDHHHRRLHQGHDDNDEFNNHGNGNNNFNGNGNNNFNGNGHGNNNNNFNGNGNGNNNFNGNGNNNFNGHGNGNGNFNGNGNGNFNGNGNGNFNGNGNGNFNGNGNGNFNGNGNGNFNGNGNGNFNGNFNGNGQLPNAHALGTLRATFHTNSFEEVAVLGHENNGMMEEWKAPDAWLCSGYGLGTLRQSSTLDKEAMFSTLHSENQFRTVAFRVLAFCIFWGAFAAMVEPLGVIADFMPFIGSCLGDAFDVIQAIVSCLPATACFFTIAGVMYVVMRPAVGAPMLLGVAAIVGLMTYAKVNRKQKEGGSGEVVLAEGTEGQALVEEGS